MDYKYDTLKAAEVVVENLKKCQPTVECPLLRDTCCRSCVCIAEPQVRGATYQYNKEKKITEPQAPFAVADWGCNNMMFFRECGE